MRVKGVHYDTGMVFRGPGYASCTRPAELDAVQVRRELEIIRDDLHANAVRVVGSDVGRLVATSRAALEAGLEVWFTPCFFDYGLAETADRLVAAAGAAQSLTSEHPGRVVFLAGGELTLFARGVIAGRTIQGRLKGLKADPSRLENGVLGAYLRDLVPRVRAAFDGPVTYAALVFERVPWDLFDFVGIDHYREARVEDRYLAMLEPFLSTGRPVVVTEVGMRTYAGADDSGALGFGVLDPARQFWSTQPLVGRFVRPRLKGIYRRDEGLQARHLAATLDLLEGSGLDGVLVATFATPSAVTDDDPLYDLDMDAMSLVKALPDGHRGTTYPDMPWEPKESFGAVARHFAGD